MKAMQKEAGPSSKELTETKDFDDFIAREGACVVGNTNIYASFSFFDSLSYFMY